MTFDPSTVLELAALRAAYPLRDFEDMPGLVFEGFSSDGRVEWRLLSLEDVVAELVEDDGA